MQKEIMVVLCDFRLVRTDWAPEIDTEGLAEFVAGLDRKFAPLGVAVSFTREAEKSLEVSGYGDLLNAVRIRSPQDHIGNLCLGHIIGQSANCDLFEDIGRGVSRVAFAPEMIEPEGSHKVVCHNCGCGC